MSQIVWRLQNHPINFEERRRKLLWRIFQEQSVHVHNCRKHWTTATLHQILLNLIKIVIKLVSVFSKMSFRHYTERYNANKRNVIFLALLSFYMTLRYSFGASRDACRELLLCWVVMYLVSLYKQLVFVKTAITRYNYICGIDRKGRDVVHSFRDYTAEHTSF